jgi:hypothetical protein
MGGGPPPFFLPPLSWASKLVAAASNATAVTASLMEYIDSFSFGEHANIRQSS